MKRLLKIAEGTANNDNTDIVVDAQNLVSRINTANDGLKQAYFVLFENLNALANGYPEIYNAIQQDVKLPETNDVRELTNLYDNLNHVLPMFMDVNYLKTYIHGSSNSDEGINSENMGDEI